MKCLILAAGYATRLYPLTKNFPKPLLKVGDKAILDWLLDDLDGTGVIDQYIVVSNHRFADHFRAWAEGRAQDIVVVDDGTSSNETRLGAVRDVQFAIDQLGLTDDLLVMAGDNLLDFSLASFIAYQQEKDKTCIMRYFESDENKLRKAGVVVTDADDKIIDMEEKPAEPKSNWCSPAFYIYKSSDVPLVKKGIESGCGVDAPGSFIAWLSTVTDVYAYKMPGKRYDIGNLESYNAVKESYKGTNSR